MPSAVMSATHAQSLLHLLRQAPYCAPYLLQTIDWIERSVHTTAGRPPHGGLEDTVLDRLEEYAASGQPGARELTERLTDARHALALVRHDHYVTLSAGQTLNTGQIAHRTHVLKLAVAVGRTRVCSGPDGTVVITRPSGSTAFQPVDAQEAHRIRTAAQQRREHIQQRITDIRQLLATHVRMAHWTAPQTAGVTVGSSGGAVTVSWWASAPWLGPGPWIEGGVRQLCHALLAHHGYTVTLTPDEALEASE
ncbi:MAG: hypothetical protein JO362_12095 [Streptomycetaceae bacterium]|nr:hypothetical protein [Streptomycetaceae bacterium]